MAKKRPRDPAPRPPAGTLPASAPPASFPVSPRVAPAILVLLFVVFYFPLLTGSRYLWEDVIEQHYPNVVHSVQSVKSGELPQWTPYVFGGMPYMADMQTGLFYPPNWLLFLLSSPQNAGGLLFTWFILLHILLLGAGVYRLSRHFGHSRLIAVYAAAALMFCGFVSTHVIHIIFLYVAAWFPFAFRYLDKAINSGRLRYLGYASFFFAFSILGGYAQYTLFFGSFLLAWTGYRAIFSGPTGFSSPVLPSPPGPLSHSMPNIPGAGERGGQIIWGAKTTLLFGLFMALAVGLVLVQYLPSLELSAESVRTQMTWEESSQGSLSFSGLLTFLAPKFFGWVSGAMEAGPGNTMRFGSPFWGGTGMHLFWETAIFVGILPIILYISAFSRLRRDRRFLFLSAVALLALLLALGKNGPLYYLVFNFVPGFGNFRLPGRFSFVFAFAFLSASAMAFQALADSGAWSPEEKKKVRSRALAAGAVAALLLLLGLLAVTPPDNDSVKKFCSRQAVGLGIFFIALSAALVVWLIQSDRKGPAQLTIIFALFLELYLFGNAFGNGKITGKEAFPPNPQIDALRAEIAANPFRLQGRIFEGPGKGVRLFGHLNAGNVYRIPIVEGYNQLHLGRLSRFVHEVEPQKGMDLFNVRYRPRTDGRGFYIEPDSSYCPRFSLRSDVRSVPDSAASLKVVNAADFDPLRQAVVEGPLSLALDPSIHPESLGTVQIKEYGPHRIRLSVSARRNSLLFASEVFYPAWHAALDGREVPVMLANFLFRGVEVPQGDHELVFEYRSQAFARGRVLSLVCLAVTLLLTLFGDRVLAALRNSPVIPRQEA